jgi:hypothetical protein
MLVHEDAMFLNQACLRFLALRECGRLMGVKGVHWWFSAM